MRISALSSDVCSSDLKDRFQRAFQNWSRHGETHNRLQLVSSHAAPCESGRQSWDRARGADLATTASPSASRTCLSSAADDRASHRKLTVNPPELFAGERRSEERRVGKGCVSTC